MYNKAFLAAVLLTCTCYIVKCECFCNRVFPLKHYLQCLLIEMNLNTTKCVNQCMMSSTVYYKYLSP